MKRLLAALMLANAVVAVPAFAGADSTDRWGDGGTGPMIWESPCGLADFQGKTPMPEKCAPVHSRDRTDRGQQN